MAEKTEKTSKKEKKIIIDAENAVMGRLASYAAKQALLGQDIIIVNSEKAIITGSRQNILSHYAQRRARGPGTQKGPNFPSLPYQILKRAIRNMLNYKHGRGERAFDKIKCYEGIPPGYEKEKKIKAGKEKSSRFMTLKELSTLIRGGIA